MNLNIDTRCPGCRATAWPGVYDLVLGLSPLRGLDPELVRAWLRRANH